jgi:hypothetical protein
LASARGLIVFFIPVSPPSCMDCMHRVIIAQNTAPGLRCAGSPFAAQHARRRPVEEPQEMASVGHHESAGWPFAFPSSSTSWTASAFSGPVTRKSYVTIWLRIGMAPAGKSATV